MARNGSRREVELHGRHWNNLSRVLFLAALFLAFLAVWLYYGYGEQLRQTADDLDEKNRALALENERLKEHVGYLTSRLDEEVAKMARQKEEEIARVRATHDEMLKAMQKEVDQGQVKITQLADRLSLNILDKILFPSGEDRISEQGKEVLKRVGAVLKQTRDKDIRIEGHTDNVPIARPLRGRFPSNWELSTARATNVVRFLQDEAGIDPASLEAVGLGEYHPISGNRTVVGRSKNRRIEIILSPRVKSLAREFAPAKRSEPPASPLR